MTIDEAAELLHVQPSTIQRRIRAGELRTVKRGVHGMVVLDPAATWLRADDAGAMLSVTSSTVRMAIGRGELAAHREHGGRWRVRLESVLTHRRCNPEIVTRFSGTVPPPPPPLPAPTRPHRLRRDVFIRLDLEDMDLLEKARDRFGSYREAIAFALRELDEDAMTPGETAELRADRDLYRDEAARARERVRELVPLVRTRLVDELYCPSCEELVPIEEAGYIELEDGTVAIYHEEHGYRRGGRVRASSVMGRRRRLEEES